METTPHHHRNRPPVTLATMPLPAKALATSIIVVLTLGMLGALGQIIVHDIIPTFSALPASAPSAGHAGGQHETMASAAMQSPAPDRGDLFTDLPRVEKKETRPVYRDEQFVWALKWTHIHLFGMSMIFIFVGAITIWLDAGPVHRTWLVVLPFIGVLVDILAVWLKAFVSPVFFWLHLPGGGLFAAVFAYVAVRALREMWFNPCRTNAA